VLRRGQERLPLRACGTGEPDEGGHRRLPSFPRVGATIRPTHGGKDRAERGGGLKKKDPAPELLLPKTRKSSLMARFQAEGPNGVAVQQLEVLVAPPSSNQPMRWWLPVAAGRRPHRCRLPAQAGPTTKEGAPAGRWHLWFLPTATRLLLHQGKRRAISGRCRAGLEETKAGLGRLVCLEGADETSYQKAQDHLRETGGINLSARQIQRLVQPVGEAAQRWQEREALQPLPAPRPRRSST